MSLTDKRKIICKKVLATGVVIIIVALLCILQYIIHYSYNPVVTEKNFSTTGCIVYDSRTKPNDFEIVPVEVSGKNLDYIFRNREDGISGDIFVNGYSIFGKDRDRECVSPGFYTGFYKNSKYTCTTTGGNKFLCEIIGISKDWQSIVCGITTDSDIGKEAGKQALLIIPSDDMTSAMDAVRQLSLHSYQMKEWLETNGWMELLKE